MKLRVVLVDDQPLVRDGLRVILEADGVIEVVGEAGDGDAALAVVTASQPDVVLMDLRMPLMDGVEATRRITAAPDAPRVLVLTTFDGDENVFEALRAGASGFLLKDAGRAELVRAVEVVAAGDAMLAPSITRRLVEAHVRRPSAVAVDESVIRGLTAREREVLELMARGLSNREIAAELVVGEATVKTHVGHLLMKLEARDRVAAVIIAYEAGLVVPGAPSTDWSRRTGGPV
jgi:DNA-binding NarL/FixJ family response regulator